jgi:excisionase family DNA binding protein
MELKEALEAADQAVETLKRGQHMDLAEAVAALQEAIRRSGEESLKASEAAQALGVHRNTIRNWAERGHIRAMRLGPRGDVMVPKAEIERLLALAKVSAEAGELSDDQLKDYFRARARRQVSRPASS